MEATLNKHTRRRVRLNEKNRPFIDKSTMQMSISWWLKFFVWFGFVAGFFLSSFQSLTWTNETLPSIKIFQMR